VKKSEKHLYRSALVALWITISASSPATADFLDSYKSGKEAIERGNWQVAEQRMRDAITGRSKESARIVKRAYIHDYVPHYYLGVALFHQDDCDGALASWAESQRQGLITRRKENDNIQAKRLDCERGVREAEMRASQRRGETQELLGQATAATDAVAKLAADPELATIWNEGAFAGRRSDAERNLAQARRRFDEAGSNSDTGTLETAEKLAASALRQLEAIRSDVEARRLVLRAEQEAEQEAEQQRVLREAEQQRVLRKAEQQRAGEKRTAALELEPPRELVAAAEAYFKGSYGKVVEILGELDFEKKRVRAQAFLLLAAAHFALHHTGMQDGEHLTAASQRVRGCHQAEPSLRPPERAFSPRFVQFFQEALPRGETAER
jgi:hypothetical protein